MSQTRPAATPAPLPTDEEIARRVLGGEIELFELLMRRHNQRVYRAIRSILRSESDVEEAMQQAYVSAWEHLGQFDGRARFSTWLVRIAVHEALGRTRKNARFVALEGGEAMRASDEPSPEARAAGRELAALLATAIDELPEMYRTVFVLREVEGLATAEAADVLEISDDAVKQRLHRARGLLREKLAARMETHAGGAFLFEAPRCDCVVAAVMERIRRA
jgi:RNA polymerase sigma-70 factor (ECF subfamily)